MVVKLVSFDVWDTLLNLDVMLELIAEGISEICGRSRGEVSTIILGVREKIRDIRRRGELGIDEILLLSQSMLAEELGVDEEIVKRGTARGVLKADPDEIAVKESYSVLKKLRKKGVKVIVIGNVMIWPSPYTRLLLEKTELARYIDKQYYADEMKVYKPMREAFLKPLSENGVEPWEAIHVGDSLIEDYRGALEAGLYAIRVDPEVTDVVKKDSRGYVVPSVTDAYRVIESIIEGEEV